MKIKLSDVFLKKIWTKYITKNSISTFTIQVKEGFFVIIYKNKSKSPEFQDFFFWIMKIAIQGISGSYHDQVAKIYFGNECTILDCMTFDDVVLSIKDGVSDFGVMAIENSIAGSLIPNYSLIDKNNLKIIGESYININHQLMVAPGVKIDDIKTISSHPMALLQCKDFLKNSNKLILEDKDTAEVAKKISKNNFTDMAAIASKKAAEIYGLDIIEKNIQTIKNNETRFVILSAEDSLNSTIEKNKASIKLILNHSNGSLAKVLNIFNNNNINLTKIQSIPVIETPWKYSFFIDVTFTNINDYINAIKNVKLNSELLKEFGLYKSEKLWLK